MLSSHVPQVHPQPISEDPDLLPPTSSHDNHQGDLDPSHSEGDEGATPAIHEEPFCLSQTTSNVYRVGQSWPEGDHACVAKTCKCLLLHNESTSIECTGGCAEIPPEALKPNPVCIKPFLVQPQDPCICPYVTCNHSEPAIKSKNTSYLVPNNNSVSHQEPMFKTPLAPTISVAPDPKEILGMRRLPSNNIPSSTSMKPSGVNTSSPFSPKLDTIPSKKMEVPGETQGCPFRGRILSFGEEAYDDCRAVCHCGFDGKLNCGIIECPHHFSSATSECMEWDSNGDFVPSPPECCPKMKCKTPHVNTNIRKDSHLLSSNDKKEENGMGMRNRHPSTSTTCTFSGLTIDNYKMIPKELLPCGTKCICINGNITCENRCTPLSDTPPPSLHCSPHMAFKGHLPGDSCCLHWVCRVPEKAGPCPQITERHLRPSRECPLPVLIAPEDPNVVCPYVICTQPEGESKSLEHVSVVAMNSTSVRVRFTLPQILVGLIGHAELHFTWNPLLPRFEWSVQKFARPNRLFDTPNIEYHLMNLKADTVYYFQIRVIVEALPSGLQSEVYKLKMPPLGEGDYASTASMIIPRVNQSIPSTTSTTFAPPPSPAVENHININSPSSGFGSTTESISEEENSENSAEAKSLHTALDSMDPRVKGASGTSLTTILPPQLRTEELRPYYIALTIMALFAAVTSIAFLSLLCIILRSKSSKAPITRNPSTDEAYDNPTYKSCESGTPHHHIHMATRNAFNHDHLLLQNAVVHLNQRNERNSSHHHNNLNHLHHLTHRRNSHGINDESPGGTKSSDTASSNTSNGSSMTSTSISSGHHLASQIKLNGDGMNGVTIIGTAQV